MKTTLALIWALTLIMIGAVPSAQAYVGPGAGLSLLGALWGLLATVVVALGYLVLWPLRRLRRQRRAAADPEQSAADPQAPRR